MGGVPVRRLVRNAFHNEPECVWCKAARPTFATADFHLWDPDYGDSGGLLTKPTPQEKTGSHVIIARQVVTSGASHIVSRRLAFGQMGPGVNEPVVELLLKGNRISIKSLDGEQYQLVSPSGGRQAIVSDKPLQMRLIPSQASWRLHFGDKSRLHRVVSFALKPGRVS